MVEKGKSNRVACEGTNFVAEASSAVRLNLTLMSKAKPTLWPIDCQEHL